VPADARDRCVARARVSRAVHHRRSRQPLS
jgi:hypothetical protein